MFKARLKPSDQGTLERRYEFHVAEAVHATLLGDHEKAAGHSARALEISRQLYASARDPAQHRRDLAAALAGHARHEQVLESVALLTESAGHYAALAATDPRRYEVERIDVLVRVALAADATGNTTDAIRLLREVIAMYRQAPATDLAAREAGRLFRCRLWRTTIRAGSRRHPGRSRYWHQTGRARLSGRWRCTPQPGSGPPRRSPPPPPSG